ncbi:hypothetical protein ACFOJE_01730 [Azotobacter bryophylli]|uniref:Uncharacterized protein n=1 Tax=Azotobacter bryophylli TaxID=1986537 RepID=A0ABV7APG4_9GAMM
MELTYKAEVEGVASVTGFHCPPLVAKPVSREAWRWIAYPQTDQCFLPVAVRNPRRLLEDPEKQCSAWGLSMFTSKEAAEAVFLKLEKKIRNIRKTIGSHVGRVSLGPADGLCTPPDKGGHFDLHPIAKSFVALDVVELPKQAAKLSPVQGKKK